MNEKNEPLRENLDAPVKDRAMRSPRAREAAVCRSATTEEVLGRRPAGWVKRNVRMTALLFLAALSTFTLQPSTLSAATVYGRLHTTDLRSMTTLLTFTPTNDVLISRGELSAGPKVNVLVTNGYFTTPLDGGDYTVTLQLVGSRRCFMISVPTDDGSYDIAGLMNPPRTYTYTNTTVADPNWQAFTNGVVAYSLNLSESVGTNDVFTSPIFRTKLSGNDYIVHFGQKTIADGITTVGGFWATNSDNISVFDLVNGNYYSYGLILANFQQGMFWDQTGHLYLSGRTLCDDDGSTIYDWSSGFLTGSAAALTFTNSHGAAFTVLVNAATNGLIFIPQ